MHIRNFLGDFSPNKMKIPIFYLHNSKKCSNFAAEFNLVTAPDVKPEPSDLRR